MSYQYNDSPIYNASEETLLALQDREAYAVDLGAENPNVVLSVDGSSAIGVIRQRGTLEGTSIAVRLFGQGGSIKVKLSGNITRGDNLKVVAGGTFEVAAAGDLSVGKALEDGLTGDIIEVLDKTQTI